MLSSWFRMKYPHIIDGAISASAPIWSFEGEQPPIDKNAFYKIITADASDCENNVRETWNLVDEYGETKEGREILTKSFSLCSSIENEEDITNLKYWLMTAW